MRVTISGNTVGATAHTYESGGGLVRHLIMNPPDRHYALVRSYGEGGYQPGVLDKTYSFVFTENGDLDEGTPETIFTVVADTESDAKQLSRLRFTQIERGQWWVMFVENALLDESTKATS